MLKTAIFAYLDVTSPFVLFGEQQMLLCRQQNCHFVVGRMQRSHLFFRVESESRVGVFKIAVHQLPNVNFFVRA